MPIAGDSTVLKPIFGAMALMLSTVERALSRLGSYTRPSVFRLGTISLTISSCRSVGIRSDIRSEEHTSELHSRRDLVCRLLLEKKNIWAAVAPFCEMAAAGGKFIASPPLHTVQSLDAAVAVYILVLAGALVVAGHILLKVDLSP